MLTASALLWTEIGASFCWMVVSGLFALYWMNRSRMGTRGFSAMPLVVFGGVFATIAALLTAHAVAGKVLTTSGGVPLWTFCMPLGCLAVAAGSLLAWFSMRAQVRADGPNAPHSPAAAMPSMLWGGALFAVVGVLFFWMLAAIH
jgi:hypothetical protein